MYIDVETLKQDKNELGNRMLACFAKMNKLDDVKKVIIPKMERILSSHLVKHTMSNSIYTQYTIDKIAEYKEPQRKGVAKGQPIGPSKGKYIASLFYLTEGTAKEKAIALAPYGVTPSLLTKWPYQTDFQELVKQHIVEFAPLFVRKVIERNGQREEAIEKYISSTPAEKIKIEDFPHTSSEGIPGSRFSPALVEQIMVEREKLSADERGIFDTESITILSVLLGGIERICHTKF